ncbi:ATP-dependent DNA helicase RecQ [Fundidesulfovibrio magnetotacticus]|uniref:ATP-dependent DNA helicase RecQ n=1 Tax=Fundidesulfovibrio magnetotacticus TaxID=2730080 RepID=A0A6V8LV94_9BACT|nr:ATP-dependent DNA helicase RecQ [Fundidesulfovibrio magnetotacticus]GFK94228.1 ATP-dependent DNA helicase RecQ [Fundidesulfovibrio magnetotacticus]
MPASSPPLPPAALTLLRESFGFESLRPGQAEAVARLLSGRSVLAIFPTGGGKSLCYQLPALLLPGVTLVVSPLLALMKDQMDFLTSRGLPAARYDSSLDAQQARDVLGRLRAGELKLLYISPERLSNERFLGVIRRVRVSLLAVDEAHCISQWGHNFRPEYLKIARTARELGVERVLALTATADRETAADIARGFAVDPADVVHTGFYRPNLELRATAATPSTRRQLLLERLRGRPRGAALVYVTLQKTAETVAQWLREHGVEARAYHAGMAQEEREAVQEAFMASGDLTVVATIAFGMGVDKADLRYVYHYNLPKGVESYAQEVGRAGRDGLPSVCELLVCPRDTLVLENFALGDTPDEESAATLLGELFGGEDELLLSPAGLANRHDIRELVVRTLLTYLELDGFVRALGHIFTDYSLTPNKPSSEMLAPFDAPRQAFLRSVLSCCRKKRGGSFALDVEDAATRTGEPRERIVAALEYLHNRGDIDLKASGTRQRYRVVRRPESREELVRDLMRRFGERENRELTRVRQMMDLAGEPNCLTRALLGYFGEERGPCGHCGPCLGEPPCRPPAFVPRAPRKRSLAKLEELLEERLDRLDTPRRLARFLCGLASPATVRLKEHQAFGLFERVPFRMVLGLAEEVLRDRRAAGA